MYILLKIFELHDVGTIR